MSNKKAGALEMSISWYEIRFHAGLDQPENLTINNTDQMYSYLRYL